MYDCFCTNIVELNRGNKIVWPTQTKKRQQRLYGLHSLKYLLADLLQKKFADFLKGQITFSQINIDESQIIMLNNRS